MKKNKLATKVRSIASAYAGGPKPECYGVPGFLIAFPELLS